MARVLRAGRILLDEGKHCLIVDAVLIDVDPKPFEIIRFLALNADRMVSNQEIMAAVWEGGVKDETYRVTLSSANSRFKEALRTAYPDVQPTPFYTRPKANHLQWALGEVEDVTPSKEPDPQQAPQTLLVPISDETVKISRNRWMIGAGVAVVVFGSFLKRWLRPVDTRQVSRIHIQADTLFALDQQGREMWHHTFKEGLDAYPTDPDELRNLYTTADLDGDGNNELIVIQIPPFPVRASAGSRVVCFHGGELTKIVEPGRALVIGPDSKGDRYTKPYSPAKVLTIPGTPFPKVAIVSLHHEDAPCQVLILNHELNAVGEYWHPGHLNVMELGDIDQDGRVELILGGVNNRHHSATLVGLDPNEVAGTTRPIIDPRVPDHKAFALLQYGDDESHLASLPVGTEKYVVLFPRSYLLFDGKRQLHFYNRVQGIRLAQGHMTIVVAENEVRASPDTILYDLDWTLNVIAAKPSKAFQDLQWKRFEERTLDHPFSKADIERLEKNVIVVKYH